MGQDRKLLMKNREQQLTGGRRRKDLFIHVRNTIAELEQKTL
jgi:hypothetical protein